MLTGVLPRLNKKTGTLKVVVYFYGKFFKENFRLIGLPLNSL